MSVLTRLGSTVAAVFGTMLSADGRRAWALIALVGGCAMFTAMAMWALHLVRGNAGFVFWLGLAAHAQVLVGMTGIAALLVKRQLKVSRKGIEISDSTGGGDAPREP